MLEASVARHAQLGVAETLPVAPPQTPPGAVRRMRVSGGDAGTALAPCSVRAELTPCALLGAASHAFLEVIMRFSRLVRIPKGRERPLPPA